MSNLLYNLTDLGILLQVLLKDLFEVFLYLPVLVIIANYIVCLAQYTVNEEKTDIQDNIKFIKFLRYLFWPTHLAFFGGFIYLLTLRKWDVFFTIIIIILVINHILITCRILLIKYARSREINNE